MVWINEKQLAGDSVSEVIICEKDRLLCSDITRDPFVYITNIYK